MRPAPAPFSRQGYQSGDLLEAHLRSLQHVRTSHPGMQSSAPLGLLLPLTLHSLPSCELPPRAAGPASSGAAPSMAVGVGGTAGAVVQRASVGGAVGRPRAAARPKEMGVVFTPGLDRGLVADISPISSVSYVRSEAGDMSYGGAGAGSKARAPALRVEPFWLRWLSCARAPRAL